MRLAGAIGAVMGIGLSGPQALAADNGSFFLRSKDAQLIVIGTTARELRICNDVASGGPIGIALGSRGPLVLQPGNCADDMGDRILATNQGSATAMGTWRTYYAPDDRHTSPMTPIRRCRPWGVRRSVRSVALTSSLKATSPMMVSQVMIPIMEKVETGELKLGQTDSIEDGDARGGRVELADY
jgi:hypothetical protein